MNNQKHPSARRDELVVQQLKDEILIYDLKVNKAFCLNETSALVWNFCDGSKSVAKISKDLSQKLNSNVTEDFVWFALDQLKKDNLLDNSQDLEINFNDLSRREVIRKVGLASMITLPIVASLIAPTAAQAQSPVAACGDFGEACTGNNSQGTCCSAGFTCCDNTCTNKQVAPSLIATSTAEQCSSALFRSFCCTGNTSFSSNCLVSNPNLCECYCAL